MAEKILQTRIQLKYDTYANWKRIAEDDELYQNAIFCYMCCTLEKYTLQNFNVKE